MADPNVGASWTDNDTIRTYTFSSWVDENPNNGIPGLVGYCVYTDQTPSTVTATYDSWKASKANQTFSFTRPNGEKSNIPLDGTTDIEIGNATFATLPDSQTILLHVSHAATCQELYPGSTATTCFVKPSPRPGPVCDASSGDTGAAYDAYPKDVVDCGPPSYAFEGNFANEFGDEVTLGAGGTLQSIKVVFNSYGCGTSGRWYTGDCLTTPGATFTIPITAKIYDPNNLTTPLATATVNQTIPYRPSGDPTNCGGTDPNGYADNSRWFNPASGQCEYSAKVLLTFPFESGPTLTSGQDYVWTVAFNTTHSGCNYIGENTQCFDSGNPPGCGYDSLNVGTKSYPNAPYAGIDPSETTFALSSGGTPYSGALVPLALQSFPADQRPLGEIVVGP